MGSSTSHHGSHPPPKQTLKRTIPSIFICGSSSSTPPIEMEDDSSEDYREPDNTPKSQRRRKEFEFTNPKNENAASSSNLDVNMSPYEDTPFLDPNSSNIIERVTQSPHLNEEINDTSEETTPLILDQEHRDEVFRDDLLVGSRELRRDGRRLFWDAFSRRNSRRNSDSQAFHDSGDSGSRERWFLDFGGNSLDRGTRNITRGRRHSRSEIWERIRGGLDGIDRRTNRCPSGLHPDGTCSCEPDTRPHASISRMVMLAEALFEVLDEIHRQPLSLSLPMLSLPAPESVIDSLPVKIYGNKHKIENDLQQCYICLAEYEEDDEIRILPCQHEFHKSCIDKWLKETQRVCPLCRGDVCGVSSPEIRQA